jgi:hypothetical protein
MIYIVRLRAETPSFFMSFPLTFINNIHNIGEFGKYLTTVPFFRFKVGMEG